ncbi:MAG: hypothetical protein QM698_06100 [Micropepsaceae bacterium]
MRAFFLSLVLLFAAVPGARAQGADPNDALRRYVNGSWQIVFREDVKGGAGDITSVGTIITITLRYDGTRTITQDVQTNNEPPIRAAEVNDFYRVEEIDGTSFTLTAWKEGEAPQTSRRKRTGADTMATEGSDAVYQRVPNMQQPDPGALPPQPVPPGGAPAAPPPQAAAPTPDPAAPVTDPDPRPAVPGVGTMGDAQARDFMVGVWTATVVQSGASIDSRIEYRASGEVVGKQTVTRNGKTQTYDFTGAYTAVATGGDSFRLTFFMAGQQPISTELQVIDQNTLYNQPENYQTKRVQ